MKYIIRWLFIIAIASKVGVVQGYQFASIQGLVDQEVAALVMTKVYQSVGLDLQVVPLPGLRAQELANAGEYDGEIMRIWAYGDQTPNVIRVPTPFYAVITMGFIKKGSTIVVNSKVDLNQYVLGKVLGVKHTDAITAEVTPKNIKNFYSPVKLIRQLHLGKIEIALTNPLEGTIVAKQLGYTDIIPLEKPLANLALYHYVHKKNADLVPKIDDRLKEMIASGELKRIIADAESVVTAQRIQQTIVKD